MSSKTIVQPDGMQGTGGPVIDVQQLLGEAAVNRRHVIIVIACCLMIIADGYNTAIIGYVAPLISGEWQMQPFMLGSLLAASAAGNFLGCLLAPAICRRMGNKSASILSAITFGIFAAIAAMAPDPIFLSAARFIAGIGLAGTVVATVAMCGEIFPFRWRSTAVTLCLTGNPLGILLAGWATRELTGMDLGWRSTMWAGAISAALACLWFAWIVPNSPGYLVNRKRDWERARRLIQRLSGTVVPDASSLTFGKAAGPGQAAGRITDRQWRAPTAALWAGVGLYSLIAGMIYSWLTTLLVEATISTQEAVLMTMIASSAGIVTGISVGPAMDRGGPVRTVSALFFIGAAGLLILGFYAGEGPTWLIIGAAFVTYLAVAGIGQGSAALTVVIYPPDLRAVGFAGLLAVSRVGLIIGPLIVGGLLQIGWSSEAVFVLSTIPMIVGGIILAIGLTRKGQSVQAH